MQYLTFKHLRTLFYKWADGVMNIFIVLSNKLFIGNNVLRKLNESTNMPLFSCSASCSMAVLFRRLQHVTPLFFTEFSLHLPAQNTVFLGLRMGAKLRWSLYLAFSFILRKHVKHYAWKAQDISFTVTDVLCTFWLIIFHHGWVLMTHPSLLFRHNK